MSKPTGGEWRVALHAYNDHWRGDGTEVLSDYGRIAETHVNGLRDPDECRANARLIAAAPALLASLIECTMACDFEARGHGGIAARAEAAIAKAEGSTGPTDL